MIASTALFALAFAAGASAKTVFATPHDKYSSSIGVLGCKINTNRVAYWPESVGCDNICVELSSGGRSVYLLRIDQSQGAYDISYDAWVYLQTGKTASQNPMEGGPVEMEAKDVDASKCAGLLDGGNVPLSASNSINFLSSCLEQPSSYIAKNHVLYNICDAICSKGHDEKCKLDLAVSNQPSCVNTLGLTTELKGQEVWDYQYKTGKKVLAGSGDNAPVYGPPDTETGNNNGNNNNNNTPEQPKTTSKQAEQQQPAATPSPTPSPAPAPAPESKPEPKPEPQPEPQPEAQPQPETTSKYNHQHQHTSYTHQHEQSTGHVFHEEPSSSAPAAQPTYVPPATPAEAPEQTTTSSSSTPPPPPPPPSTTTTSTTAAPPPPATTEAVSSSSSFTTSVRTPAKSSTTSVSSGAPAPAYTQPTTSSLVTVPAAEKPSSTAGGAAPAGTPPATVPQSAGSKAQLPYAAAALALVASVFVAAF